MKNNSGTPYSSLNFSFTEKETNYRTANRTIAGTVSVTLPNKPRLENAAAESGVGVGVGAGVTRTVGEADGIGVVGTIEPSVGAGVAGVGVAGRTGEADCGSVTGIGVAGIGVAGIGVAGITGARVGTGVTGIVGEADGMGMEESLQVVPLAIQAGTTDGLLSSGNPAATH